MSREVIQQALEALEWFVKNDDTVIGMQGNEFWEAGLNRGIDTVAVLRKELANPDHIPDAGKMVGPEPVLFIHPATLEMASAHVGAWKPGHELPGYIALYTSPPHRQPIRREQRMCPNTYYECGRGCGDGPCKDFDDAYDIKEKIE